MTLYEELGNIHDELCRLDQAVVALRHRLSCEARNVSIVDEPITVLGLGGRAENCLARAKICTISQLREVPYRTLLDLQNCGRVTAQRILWVLSEYDERKTKEKKHEPV